MIRKLRSELFNIREDFNGTKMELVKKINELVEVVNYLLREVNSKKD